MNKSKYRNLIYIVIAIAVNLLLAAIAIFVFGVRYVVDDDVSMSYIAYGIYMKPSARIVYSNIVIGWLMKSLFAIKSTINWQTVLYFAGLCSSGFISLYEVLKTKRVKMYLFWAIFVLSFFYCSFVMITFTVVAVYVCCQGYFALFLSVKEENTVCIAFSGLSIVYASLIRFESILAVSMCAAMSWVVVVLSYALKEKCFDIKKIARKYIYPFVWVVLVVGIFYLGNKLAYSSGEWASYYEYYVLRGEVLDDCSIITMDDNVKQRELGISVSTADTLNEWCFNDPDVFNKELFAQIDKASSELRREYIPNPFGDMFFAIDNIVKTEAMLVLNLLVLLILVLIALFEKKSIKAGCLFASIIPFLIQIFAYCFMGRYSNAVEKTLPSRLVEITVMSFSICFILIEIGYEEKLEMTSLGKKRMLAVLSVAVLLILGMQMREKPSIRGFSLVRESEVENNYSFLNDGHIYVMDYRALQTFMNEYGVWQNPPQGYLKNYIMLGGCEINYPYLVEKQKELGVSNPYKSLYTNGNVYFVTTGEPNIELEYLRDMYDDDIEYELSDVQDKLYIYKFYTENN